MSAMHVGFKTETAGFVNVMTYMSHDEVKLRFEPPGEDAVEVTLTRDEASDLLRALTSVLE